MQRFHNLEPLPQLHLLPPLAPSQPLGSFLVIDAYPIAEHTSHKRYQVFSKKQPKSLQPSPRKLQIAKIQSLPPEKEQAKVVQKIRDDQSSKPSVYFEKKMGLGSNKKRNKIKQFILETLLKAKAQGNCLVISKGTAQPQIHASSPINIPKKNNQPVTRKQNQTRLQLPKALIHVNRQRLKPQASTLILPSIKISKRMLSVAREMAERRERKEERLSKPQEIKQANAQPLLQVEPIQEKIQVEEEREIQEDIIVGSIED